MKVVAKKYIYVLSRIFFVPINYLIGYKVFWIFFNGLYERCPWIIINFIDPLIKIPNQENEWIINLVNGEQVKVLVSPDDVKTWHFAHSYKWHAPSINLLEDLLDRYYPPSVLYLDIGANLGLRSLFALSKSRPTIMFEPNNQLNQVNTNRAKLNGFRNFEIVAKGVSSQEGLLRFYIDKSSYLSSFHENAFSDEMIDEVLEVPTIRLDDFVSSRNITEEFFVKIDVEGHEWEVIRGGENTIRTLSPSLIIEINEKGDHFQKMISFFAELGYVVYSIARVPRCGRFLIEVDLSKGLNELLSNDFLFVKNRGLVEKLRPFIFSS